MLEPALWVGLLIAALAGFAKAGVPGTGILAVPLIAFLFDGKASMGALLPILIMADIIAVVRYHKKVVWSDIKAVVLWVAVGMVLGGLGLFFVEGDSFGRVLGGLLMGILLLDFLRVKLRWDEVPHSKAFEIGFGILAGFATVLGNAAGPVMTIYFMARGQEKFQFVASRAWFFLGVNLCKVPIYGALGLFSMESLKFNVQVFPGVILGAIVGIWILPRINPFWFKLIVLSLVFVSALRLLIA